MQFGNGVALPTASREILVKFPRGGIKSTFTDADKIGGLRERIGKSGNLSIIHVKLHDDAKIIVDGYGLPFANIDHPSHGWLNDNQPMIEATTLAGFLQQRDFFLAVAFSADDMCKFWDYDLLPPPFSFPYGTVHNWNPTRYNRCTAETSGPVFARSWTFEDSNSHVAVITQSVVQDTLWIANAAAAIFATALSAYFVPTEIGSDDSAKTARTYFVIVKLPQDLRSTYEQQWKALTNCEAFKLAFHADDAKLSVPQLEDAEEWAHTANFV
jgi:hypothetical protein